MRIQLGDTITVSRADGARPGGKAVWKNKNKYYAEGAFWAACGEIYTFNRMREIVADYHRATNCYNSEVSFDNNYECMMEQMMCDGTFPTIKERK